MCFGPILHQKSKNVNFVKFDEFPSHRVRTANRALGCTDLDKKLVFCIELRLESWLGAFSDPLYMPYRHRLKNLAKLPKTKITKEFSNITKELKQNP